LTDSEFTRITQSISSILKDHALSVFKDEVSKKDIEDKIAPLRQHLEDVESENRRLKISIKFLENELKAAKASTTTAASIATKVDKSTQIDELMFFKDKNTAKPTQPPQSPQPPQPPQSPQPPQPPQQISNGPLQIVQLVNGPRHLLKRPGPQQNGPQPNKVLLAVTQTGQIAQSAGGANLQPLILPKNMPNGMILAIPNRSVANSNGTNAVLLNNVTTTQALVVRSVSNAQPTINLSNSLSTNPLRSASTTNTSSVSTVKSLLAPKTLSKPFSYPPIKPKETIKETPSSSLGKGTKKDEKPDEKPVLVNVKKKKDTEDDDEIMEVEPPPQKIPEVVDLDDDDDSPDPLQLEIKADMPECKNYHPLSALPLPFKIDDLLLPHPRLSVRHGKSRDGKKAVILRMESSIDASKITGILQYRIFNYQQNISVKPQDRAWKQLTVIKVQSGRICECTLTQLQNSVRYHFVVCLINGNNRSRFSNCASTVF